MPGHLNRAVHRYLIALGSNRRHARHGAPRRLLRAALAALEQEGMRVLIPSPIVETRPLGPSQRRFANATALIEGPLMPEQLLISLKRIERRFGRRRGGRRWGERVLDLDIVLWDGGIWRSPQLEIPHAAFRERRFVLGPAVRIAGAWRDPCSGLTLRQLDARLTRPRALFR